MRIWHEQLIPKLCRQHLLGCWREGLACWSILTNDKKGFRNHPQVKMYESHLPELHKRLKLIRKEMLKRDYNPKEIPLPERSFFVVGNGIRRWQSLEEQTEILRAKCKECKV